MKTDAQLEQDVMDELSRDPTLDGAAMSVAADQGTVTLAGMASSYAERLAAQEAALRVVGVLDLANDVEVRAPDRAAEHDTRVARAVRQALEREPRVPHAQIQSVVSRGWVTLEGQVATWMERLHAEHAVRQVGGVRGISNRLHVTAAYADAAQVHHEIELALERRAARHARDIAVDVRHGHVAVYGPIQTQAERRAVLGAARHAGGWRAVDDHLWAD